jgi:hypothetical protein
MVISTSSEFETPLGGGALRQQALEHAPRDPDHAAVFSDLDSELYGLPLSVPPGVLGKGEEHGASSGLGLP